MLAAAGYTEIGMDHFALERTPFISAMEAGTLHRNFMGYTSSRTRLMVGLGVSSISDSGYGFSQNVKQLRNMNTWSRTISSPYTGDISLRGRPGYPHPYPEPDVPF